MARCDAQQIVTVVANVLLKARAVEQCGSEPSRLLAEPEEEVLTHAAMDGKTLRGTLGHESEGQPPVQKKWCACVHGYGGYYLTIVKKNQPQMYEDLLDFFEDPEAEQEEWQYAKSVQKGHGRLERRELWASTQMNAWFETEWAGVAQVFRLHRDVKERDNRREETVYGLTNLLKARKPTPPACSPSNKRIGGSRIGCIIAGMSPWGKMRARCGLRALPRRWRLSMEGARFDGLAPGSQCPRIAQRDVYCFLSWAPGILSSWLSKQAKI